MSSPRKPKAWNIKGHLTQAPELWRGCVLFCPFFAHPLWQSWGSVIISPEEATVRLEEMALLASPVGTAVSHTGSGGLAIDYTTPGLRMTQKTHMSAFMYLSQDGQNTWAKGLSEGHDDTYTLQAQHFSFLAPSMRIWSVNGYAEAVATTDVTDGKFHSLLGTYDGDAGSVTMDVDGVEEAIGSTTGAMATVTEDTFVMVNSRGTPVDGTCAIAALWDRTLTKGERELLGRDPFVMMRPAGF